MPHKIEFISAFKECGECENPFCLLVEHEDIELNINFSKANTPDEFINMMIRFMVADMYIPTHVITEKNTQNSSKLLTRYENEIETLKRSMTYCEPIKQDLTKQLYLSIRKKWTDEKKRYDKYYSDLKQLYMKMNRIGNKENQSSREWKQYIRNNWDASKIQNLIQERNCMEDELSACLFHGDKHIDCKEELYNLYPEIYKNLTSLMKTDFEKETETQQNDIQFADFKNLSIDEKQNHDDELFHSLVKRSRFRFEYVVGKKSEIDLLIGNQDTEFFESIKRINPNYQEVIHTKLKALSKTEQVRVITYDGNYLTVKKNAKTSMKQIAALYKHIHD